MVFICLWHLTRLFSNGSQTTGLCWKAPWLNCVMNYTFTHLSSFIPLSIVFSLSLSDAHIYTAFGPLLSVRTHNSLSCPNGISSKSPESRNVTECHSSPSENLLLFFFVCLFYLVDSIEDVFYMTWHHCSFIHSPLVAAIFWLSLSVWYKILAVVMVHYHWSPMDIFLWMTEPWRQISWPDLASILNCHQWWKSQNPISSCSALCVLLTYTLSQRRSYLNAVQTWAIGTLL